ncbi:MAG: hypothetical protein ACYS14_05370, partial [Planctomycetota bacterium]
RNLKLKKAGMAGPLLLYGNTAPVTRWNIIEITLKLGYDETKSRKEALGEVFVGNRAYQGR